MCEHIAKHDLKNSSQKFRHVLNFIHMHERETQNIY